MKILLLLNIFSFLLMGFDKFQAKRRGQRIPEKALLLLALLGGGIGSFAGTQFFCHKTKKKAFQIILPLAFLLTLYYIYSIYTQGIVYSLFQ